MNVIKLLIVLGIIGGGFQYWKEHQHGVPPETIAGPVIDENGFTSFPPVNGASSGTVLVVAAENCPGDAAQRADRLADDLSRQGIPAVRTHNVSFRLASEDSSVIERITSIMNGPLPIVILNGRARSNPTLDDVVAEYNGTHE